jgi:hypothetical protein
MKKTVKQIVNELVTKEKKLWKTNETCEIAGIYQPSCGHKECAVNKGSNFPPCPKCQKPRVWALFQATK